MTSGVRRLRALLIVALALAVPLTIAYRFQQRARQHENLINSKFARRAIDEWRKATGSLPADLTTVSSRYRDSYGHPFYYATRGTAYVLVSFGRDGKPDGSDYWAVREEPPPAAWAAYMSGPNSICGRPNDDMVISDRGIHRACAIK